MKKYFIKTFGCIQNTIDSDQIRQIYLMKGYEEVESFKSADVVIINSCVVRESAENRVYGMIEEIRKYLKREKRKIEIIVTGCLTGWKNTNKKKRDSVDNSFPDISFIPLSKMIGKNKKTLVLKETGLISISYGCNNYCSYCVVPLARGPERSVDFSLIVNKAKKLISDGVKKVLLVGQNVNSYGTDLLGDKNEFVIGNKSVKAVMVKSMGKNRIPTLFPHLLEEICKLGFEKISFVSSNPWDFSDELIGVISENENIDRLIHLPIQAGSDSILSKMNRSYTVDEYCKLVQKIRKKVKDVKISTDIIIGFPGETDEIFEESVKIYKKLNFDIAYLNKYSQRSGTLACKIYKDDILPAIKKERWKRLDKMINRK